MGTRSLTIFVDEREGEIAVMYRQFDGYPEGHGVELKEWGGGRKIVNGLPFGEGARKLLNNGMGCVAASCVAHFKTEAGGFYLHPGGTRDCGEEYIYYLSVLNSRLYLDVNTGRKEGPPIWSGYLDDFDPETCEK